MLIKKVKSLPGGLFISSPFEGGDLFEREGLFNLEGTMISVFFKEPEHKVEKLKNKKVGGHAAEQPASKLSVTLWWQGRKRKKSLQQCLWNLNIPIKKADVKC